MNYCAARRVGSAVVLAALLAGIIGDLQAQRLVVDPTFALRVLARSTDLSAIELSPIPDGRFLMRGNFSFVDGVPAAGLAVLLPDGSRDATFSFAGGPLTPTSRVVRLADGRLLVARSDYDPATYSGAMHFQRYLADGSLDVTFVAFETSVGWVNQLVLQADGHVIVAGKFAQLGGLAREGLARLVADGTLDASYAPSLAGSSTAVTDLVVGSDGVVTVTAQSTDVDPYTIFLRRIRPNGSTDPGFVPASGVYPVYAGLLAALPDGSVLMIGSDSSGFAIFKFDATGAATPFIQAPPGSSAITPLSDGRMIVGAAAQDGLSVGKTGILLLRAGGTIEKDYRALFANDEALQLVAVAATGDLIVRHGKWFVPVVPPGVETVAPVTGVMLNPAFARVDLAGTTAAVLPINTGEIGLVQQTQPLASGTLLVSGRFDQINGTERHGLARLRADGSVDPGFVPSPVEAGYRLALAQPDGRLLAYVTPGFDTGDGTHRVVRLLNDGSIDPTLPSASEMRTRRMRVHAIDASGRVVASFFDPDNTREANLKLAWFNPDGSRASTLATSFDGLPQYYVLPPSSGPAQYLQGIDDVQLLDDGGLLISGRFKHANSQTARGLVRLRADGQVDPSYQPPIRADDPFSSTKLLSGGRVLLSTVRQVGARWESRRERLLPDGTSDPTFAPRHDAFLSGALVQRDGTFISLGDRLRRWSAAGIPDLNVDVSFDGNAVTAETAADGTVYVGGSFRRVQGVASFGLARLRPVEAPGITVQPRPQTVFHDKDAEFQVAIGDFGPATYQWQFNGVNLPGTTSPVLVVANIRAANAGAYRVIVTAGTHVYVSDAVALALKSSAARLINFSARSRVYASRAPQIAGFVTGSTSPRPVLLRAIGRGLPWDKPQLSLPRPALGLFAGMNQIARNEGGALDPAIQSVARRVGAFDPRPRTFPENLPAADSALLADLTLGVFTAHTTSANAAEGVSLFEFYDAGDTPTPGFVKNVSLRGHTAPADDTMIGGFVIGGDGPLTLLLRVVGPELNRWEVTDALADPELTLYWNSSPIDYNDDWSGMISHPLVLPIREAEIATGAFPLDPNGKSAALVVSLDPGQYTVHATGKNGTAGEVLLEIYVVEE